MFCPIIRYLQLKKALTTTIWYREETLLNAAADGGSKEVFDAVVELLDGAVRILLSTI